MAKIDEMKAELVEINTSTSAMATAMTEIESDVDDLVSRATGGVSAAEADAFVADLKSLKADLVAKETALKATASKWTPSTPI